LGLDRRALLVAGRALLTQVMHPVISAAVEDFSSFRTDPWGRLDRTVTSLVTQVFGGPAAVAEGHRLREVHRSIQGVGPHGSRYSALSAEPYAWTHLSNFDAALVMHDLFGTGLTPEQQRRLYAEWRQIGTTLGIPDRNLPADLDAFHDYVDEMTRLRLEHTRTSSDLLRMLALDDVPPPPSLPLARLLWPLARPLGRFMLRETTIGTLPPTAREKLGLQWSADRERRLRQFAAVVRATAPLVPERVRDYPMAYRAKQAARRYQALQRHG